MLVRTERLELSHLSILEPKSSASTNSATSAVGPAFGKAVSKRALYLTACFCQESPELSLQRLGRYTYLIPVLMEISYG